MQLQQQCHRRYRFRGTVRVRHCRPDRRRRCQYRGALKQGGHVAFADRLTAMSHSELPESAVIVVRCDG